MMFGFLKKNKEVKNQHLFVWDIDKECFKYVHSYPNDGSVFPFGGELHTTPFAVAVDDGKIKLIKNRFDKINGELVFSSFYDLMLIYETQLIQTSKEYKKFKKGKTK